MKYNLNFFSILIRLTLILFFFFISGDNFGIHIKNKLIKETLKNILTLIRICLLAYLLIVLSIDYVFLVIDTFYLNDKNWWKSSNEPFFTNASLINALISWPVWYFNIFS